MFKYGLFGIALGAGAAYYWWTHHNSMDDDLRRAGDKAADMAKDINQTVEREVYGDGAR